MELLNVFINMGVMPKEDVLVEYNSNKIWM